MSQHDSTPDSRVVMDVGEGQVVQEAGSWSIRRSLSGGGLPGQARAVSGSSVGSGQVQIVSHAGRSPWTPGPVRPGGRVGVEARADVDRPWSSVAQMTARSVSGTARSQALDVDVEDDLGALLGPVAFPTEITSSQYIYDGREYDAADVVARAAAVAGFHAATPASPVHRTHLLVPLTGGWAATVGTTPDASAPDITWTEVDGQIGAAQIVWAN